MNVTKIVLTALAMAFPLASLSEDSPQTDLPLIFQEDFEKGRERWETTDEKSWTYRKVDGNQVFGINRRNSDYEPKVRSPRHIALIKDVNGSVPNFGN